MEFNLGSVVSYTIDSLVFIDVLGFLFRIIVQGHFLVGKLEIFIKEPSLMLSYWDDA
jgi:hypothetical protein